MLFYYSILVLKEESRGWKHGERSLSVLYMPYWSSTCLLDRFRNHSVTDAVAQVTTDSSRTTYFLILVILQRSRKSSIFATKGSSSWI